MPSTTTRRNSEGFYFVVVDGWQELKDYLRDSVKVTPGYADVLKVHTDGTRLGYCMLRNKAEANKAFEYLVAEGWRGLNIRVSLCRKAEMHAELFERLRGPEPSKRRRMTNSVPPMPNFPTGEPAAIRPMTAATPTSMYNMTSMVQALPANNVAVPDARSRALAYPQYVQAPTSMSVGTLSRPSTSSSAASKATNGYSFSSSQAMSVVRSLSSVELEERIYTEGQAIHISRLPHNIEPEAVKKELSKYGKVSCIAVKRGKEKRCSATARFQSAAQAELAINKLNGSRWGKLNVTVRLDRSEVGSGSSSASVGTAGSDDSDSSGARSRLKSPLVVNGARGPVYHKTTLDADDSESEGQPPKVQSTSKTARRPASRR